MHHWDPPADHPLTRLFAGYTEHTFLTAFGIADPPLVDYLSTLLARFIHTDALFRLRGGGGRPLESVAELATGAGELPTDGRTCREVHRHIGDFALFWAGVYPETIARLQAGFGRDAVIDFCQQGKRSYKIAGSFADDPYREEAAVLRRLSDEFELCAYGLTQVRREWETGLPDATVLGHKLIG